jgi:hypothetical protein
LQQWSDLKTKSLLATAAIKPMTKLWPFTPIDAITLLDKVLVHEFTHTRACGQRSDVRAIFFDTRFDVHRSDILKVSMAKGGAPHFKLAYGWKAATKLAKKGTGYAANDPKDPNRTKSGEKHDMPVHNSDSFALFASGRRGTSLPYRARTES